MLNRGNILKRLEELETKTASGLFVIVIEKNGKRKRYEYLELFELLSVKENENPLKIKSLEFLGDYPSSGILQDMLLRLSGVKNFETLN